MEWKAALEAIVQGQNLTEEQAAELMASVFAGQVPPSVVGGFLVGLRAKGATGEELAGFARVMQAEAVRLRHDCHPMVDTCGTGGGLPTFNLSTAAAFVAAAAGAKVGKHGNRAVASRCGSADVLEALGVSLHADPERLLHILETVGMVFLFAPSHHPAMRHVGPVRKELGIRTVFNQLGPLSNPAGADAQLIGVFSPTILRPMAEAAAKLGIGWAMVVHGLEGLDEISPCGPTASVLVEEGVLRERTLHPEDFGQQPLDASALRPGEDAEQNAAILREAVSDPGSPRCAAVIPSAAAAIWLAGLAPDLREAAEKARQAVASGAALRKLLALVEASRV
ncbi:MAG: anthranilate phosphoribosyltransferase [Fimbriimonadales bacterium]|nr:anthranilate phosphoribosyltransferase [Fimbriimonadales bacterium]